MLKFLLGPMLDAEASGVLMSSKLVGELCEGDASAGGMVPCQGVSLLASRCLFHEVNRVPSIPVAHEWNRVPLIVGCILLLGEPPNYECISVVQLLN